MTRNLLKRLCLFTGLAAANPVLADLPTATTVDPIVQGPPSDNVWQVGGGVENFRLRGVDGHDVRGYAGFIGFGYSWFATDGILTTGGINIITGPADRIRNNSFDSDFFGVAANAESLFCVAASCRLGSWMPGVLGSFTYFDISGRSLGANRHDTGDASDPSQALLEQKYKINVSGLWAYVGLLWLRFETPRPTGNTADLLTTRIEGTAFRLGVGGPVVGRYRATVTRRDSSQSDPRDVTEKGKMYGFSVMASIQTWLGT